MVSTIQPTSGADETSRLIAADKVVGSSVENMKGDNLGKIDEIMVDKVSGEVAYAVLKYGSFLGMGGKLFALPWDVLQYDVGRSAYVIDLPEEKLKNAPSFDQDNWPDFGNRTYDKELHDYYGSRADWYL